MEIEHNAITSLRCAGRSMLAHVEKLMNRDLSELVTLEAVRNKDLDSPLLEICKAPISGQVNLVSQTRKRSVGHCEGPSTTQLCGHTACPRRNLEFHLEKGNVSMLRIRQEVVEDNLLNVKEKPAAVRDRAALAFRSVRSAPIRTQFLPATKNRTVHFRRLAKQTIHQSTLSQHSPRRGILQ